jgi:hypothetical protein
MLPREMTQALQTERIWWNWDEAGNTSYIFSKKKKEIPRTLHCSVIGDLKGSQLEDVRRWRDTHLRVMVQYSG